LRPAELLEETGLWPAASTPSAAERVALLAGELSLEALLQRYPPMELAPAGLRITPDYAGIRFSAQFFAALIPKEQVAQAQQPEIEQSRWWPVAEARRAWQDSEIFLASPTLLAVEQLFQSASWQEAAAALEAVNPVTDPPIAVCPGLSYVPLETPTLPPRGTRWPSCSARNGWWWSIREAPTGSTGDSRARAGGGAGGGRPLQPPSPDHVGGQHWPASAATRCGDIRKPRAASRCLSTA